MILMDFAYETPHGSQLDENGSPVQTTYLGFLQSPQLFLSGYFLSSIDLIYSTLLFQVSRLSTFAKFLFPCLMGGFPCVRSQMMLPVAFDVEIPMLHYIPKNWGICCGLTRVDSRFWRCFPEDLAGFQWGSYNKTHPVDP